MRENHVDINLQLQREMMEIKNERDIRFFHNDMLHCNMSIEGTPQECVIYTPDS